MRLILPCALLVATGCAQVPKQSVTLANTVGRDLTEVHRAHRALAELLYARMRADVNEFVDEVYAPYQIQKSIAEYQELFVTAINDAAQPDSGPEAQRTLLGVFEIYLEEVRRDVEDYRSRLLTPLREQEAELLARIDQSYGNIHYANSIVVGHLASVVEVHDTQNELLAEIDPEFVDLRDKVGTSLSGLSGKISGVLEASRRLSEPPQDIGGVEEQIGAVEDLAESLEDLVNDPTGADGAPEGS